MKDYVISSKVIVRTPRKSFNELKSFYESDIEVLFNQVDIKEAICIASFDLYEKLQKYSLLDFKEKERVKNAFMRYMTRMSTRCSPFGLFAGCSIAAISDCTDLILLRKVIKHVRMDMSYLCSLSQYLSNIPSIKCKLKYYPNNSIYIVGYEYRYVEYIYMKNKRTHRISSIKKTSYLEKILQISRNGAYIEDICSCIINDYIQKDDVLNYIYDLINSQILVSELDPTVTGNDLLYRILSILRNVNDERYHSILKSIQDIMIKMNESENILNELDAIEKHVKDIGAPYNYKYLLQVDMNNIFVKNTIAVSIINEIESTVKFLRKIIPIYEDENLFQFQKKFIERFGEREVPLLIALDPEVGLGYPLGNGYRDVSLLLEGFDVQNNISTSHSVNCDMIQSVVLKKISENNSLSEIEIEDEDFEIDKEFDYDLPNTFSVFFEILRDNGNDYLIRIKSIGHSSAANLLARFAYTDERIEDFTKEITRKEQSLKSNVILAEIVHLPDSRVGNILFRPHLRNYEITYLANSSMPEDMVISGSDIMISVKYGKLYLRSKRLNKEILPCLTTAHNYSLSSLPLYRFLCDIQYQNKQISLMPNTNFLFDKLSYVPRIRYKNTILSRAMWNVNVKEIEFLISIKDDQYFLDDVKKWRCKRKIPRYSLFSDGDSELFIDWENITSIRSFFSVLKTTAKFRLMEFLYDDNNYVIRDGNGNGYMNEFIISMLKN